MAQREDGPETREKKNDKKNEDKKQIRNDVRNTNVRGRTYCE